jgi:hypothetical protein
MKPDRYEVAVLVLFAICAACLIAAAVGVLDDQQTISITIESEATK